MKLNCNILAMNTRKVKFINSIYASMAARLLDILIIHIFWYSQPCTVSSHILRVLVCVVYRTWQK